MTPPEHFEDLLADDDDELIVIDFDELESEPASGVDSRDGDYPGFQRWIKDRGLRLIDAQIHAERMSRWSVRPRFLMVCMVGAHELPLVARTLANLERQLYKDWIVVFISDQPEPSPVFRQSDCLGWICVESLADSALVTGHLNELPSVLRCDWMTRLPPGFELEEQALLVLGDYINLHPEWAALYTDDYVSDGAGNFSRPRFKPDFDIDHFRAYDYIGEALWFNATALGATGGLVELGDASFYEMLLRTWERVSDQAIGHIAEPVLRLPVESIRSDTDSPMHDAAVTAHLERTAMGATVGQGIVPGVRLIRWALAAEPSVTIIIPTRDKLEYLAPCVESLLEKTRYQNYEILIVDNQSSDPDTLKWLEAIPDQSEHRVRVLRWDHEFNFSAICNFATENCDAEFVCLVNNDTEALQEEWLSRMVGLGQRPDVGVVGCRLTFPETGKVQHAGIVLGLGHYGIAAHPFAGESRLEDAGPLCMAQLVRNASAVTAACMLVRRADYVRIGGFDEQNLPVLFNDVDFCLRMRESGKRVLWSPYSTLVHHEGVSLTGRKDFWQLAAIFDRSLAERRYMLKRWGRVIGRDPFYNRHLALSANPVTAPIKHYSPVSAYPLAWDPEFNDRPRVVAMPLAGGSGLYRITHPLTACCDAGLLQFVGLDTFIVGGRFPTHGELLRLKPDVLAVHAAIGDQAIDFLRELDVSFPNIRRVFSLDDLVSQLSRKNNLFKHFVGQFRDARPRLRAALRECDRLIVSTQPLADLCRDMVEDIVIVPNRLNDDWRGLKSQRNVGRRPRVGWVGALQHQGDLEVIDVVVETLRDEVDFVFMGMATDRIKPCLAEFHDAVPWEQYPAKLASLNLDIALAPLEMVPFNEAKSNLRILECGSVGWPMICSDIFPFQQDDAPVTRLPNDAEAWIEAIRALAADPERRAREGDALRAWVLSRYMLTDHLDSWMKAVLA